LFLAAVLAASVAPAAADTAGQAADDTAGQAAEAPSDAIVLYHHLNRVRSRDGVGMLALDRRLVQVAREHALDMVARHYFAHAALDGRSPFDRLHEAGIDYAYAGENLAMDVNPDAANLALLESPPHRENMLEPHYRRVGIAAVRSSEGEEIFVEDFSD
jgi:uncharacterized protein YkwD